MGSIKKRTNTITTVSISMSPRMRRAWLLSHDLHVLSKALNPEPSWQSPQRIPVDRPVIITY